jgi:hypothetical protein
MRGEDGVSYVRVRCTGLGLDKGYLLWRSVSVQGMARPIRLILIRAFRVRVYKFLH